MLTKVYKVRLSVHLSATSDVNIFMYSYKTSFFMYHSSIWYKWNRFSHRLFIIFVEGERFDIIQPILVWRATNRIQRLRRVQCKLMYQPHINLVLCIKVLSIFNRMISFGRTAFLLVCRDWSNLLRCGIMTKQRQNKAYPWALWDTLFIIEIRTLLMWEQSREYKSGNIWILTLYLRGLSYLGLTRSISLLLMPWLLMSPGHQ